MTGLSEAFAHATERAGVKPRCRQCTFWVCDQPQQFSYGFCHRLPPQTIKHVHIRGAKFGNDGGEVTITDTNNPAWPNTNEDDWCGEFSVRSMPLPDRVTK